MTLQAAAEKAVSWLEEFPNVKVPAGLLYRLFALKVEVAKARGLGEVKQEAKP